MFAAFTVMASMAYPRDVDARNHALAVAKAKAASNLQAGVQKGTHAVPTSVGDLLEEWLAPHGGFASLGNMAGSSTLREDLQREYQSGIVAGRVLWWVVALHQAREKASINKAVFLFLNQREPTSKINRTSKRQVFRDWQQHKTTAHLWIAWNIWAKQTEAVSPNADAISPSKRHSLPVFLAVAEVFRRVGLHLLPQGQKFAVLDPSETWQPPPDILLPDIEITLLLDDNSLDRLRDYRAVQI
jgi:hypothetical protein